MGGASRRKHERQPGKRTTLEVLRNAQQTLHTAAFGAEIVRASTEPSHRLIGVRNTVVFGRAVLNILENLRATEQGFEAWYQAYRSDPLIEFLVELRNRILKEGEIRTAVVVNIAELDMRTLRQRFPKAPPGAKAFFIGDALGGSGWEVELPGGGIEKFYVDLPRTPGLLVDTSLHFLGAPEEFRGMPIETVCALLVEFLGKMVANAGKQFVA